MVATAGLGLDEDPLEKQVIAPAQRTVDCGKSAVGSASPHPPVAVAVGQFRFENPIGEAVPGHQGGNLANVTGTEELLVFHFPGKCGPG